MHVEYSGFGTRMRSYLVFLEGTAAILLRLLNSTLFCAVQRTISSFECSPLEIGDAAVGNSSN